MLDIIIGGSASGKSTYGENLLSKYMTDEECEAYYIATMNPYDEESKARVCKHRLMRQNKGFMTLECQTNICQIKDKVKNNVGIIECMSNLLANEMYDIEGTVRSKNGNFDELINMAKRVIVEPIIEAGNESKHLIVVTNEVFGEENNYSEETLNYVNLLGMINNELSKAATNVWRIVCGVEIKLK